MNALATCRFCHSWEGAKIKYGTRHYAHPQCYFNHKGKDVLLALPAWKLKNLPWMFVRDNNLESDIKAAILKAEGGTK